jgi:hypothetical protein
VDKFFKTLEIFTRQIRKQLSKIYKGSERGKKTLASLASGFIFLLANPEFYSHLASWRMVIRTPAFPIKKKSALNGDKRPLVFGPQGDLL